MRTVYAMFEKEINKNRVVKIKKVPGYSYVESPIQSPGDALPINYDDEIIVYLNGMTILSYNCNEKLLHPIHKNLYYNEIVWILDKIARYEKIGRKYSRLWI